MDNELNKIISDSQIFNHKDIELIKNKGVVFTPKKICDIIINNINPEITQTICEPSVGGGIFVFSLLEFFRKKGYSINEIVNFVENKLYCYDIDNNYINQFKLSLTKYLSILGNTKELNLFNISCQDFLLTTKKYDLIIGNPPFIRIQNLNKDYLNQLKNNLVSVTIGNIDLYYAFIEKSLSISKKLGFIIPNSFIKNKSGVFLRQILKNRISYLYDFKTNKVWNEISTYTCIIICDEQSSILNYKSNEDNIIKKNSELSDNIWIFSNDIKHKDNKLSDLINFSVGGLATIKDSVFKMDNINDDYCYKKGYKIEKGICKKVIKATKNKKFSDYKWIIYPYDNNCKILSETYIINNFPLAHKYLLKNKDNLANRDKGKTDKYEAWYAYGRRQGLLKPRIGKRIILPLTFLKSRGIHYIEIPDEDECLILSGILIDIKPEFYHLFIKIISNKNFYNYCEANNKTLTDKSGSNDIWLCITATTIKNYLY